MKKHTPGPWVARPVQNPSLKDHTGYAIDFNADQEQVVDFVYEQADAVLIAAAPQMLDDLIAAAAQLRHYEILHLTKGTTDSLAKAEVNAGMALRLEKTIALATGIQPVIGTSSPLGQRGIQISQITGSEPLP